MVVPTRDRLGYLQQAVGCVLGQTREDLRLVVSDNASTDGTADWLATVDDPRLTVVRHQVDVGMTGNFNGALSGVTTPFAALLLDDDLWSPRLLERALPLLEDDPRTGMVHTAFRVVGPHGEVLHAYQDWHAPERVRPGRRPGRELVADLLGRHNPVLASSVVYRTAALPPTLFEAVDVQAEDLGMYLRLALHWDVAFVPEPLAGFRQHGGSVSVAASHDVGDGLTPGFRQVAERRAAKERFLDAHGAELGDEPRWRREVARHACDDALGTVWALTRPARDL
ncbi:MAG: hypothetical protein JWO60_3244, partial [Frankiales bacterium]|nr:hypothetical protein [Frankiales bacterium]